MRKEFEIWMREKEGKALNTVKAYSNAIDKVSNHNYENTGERVDLYMERDLAFVEKVSELYGTSGRFTEFGNIGNGTNRAAIKAYVKFLKSKITGNNLSDTAIITNFEDDKQQPASLEDQIVSNNNSFTYERDLKYSLIGQVEDLFPEYKIFGINQEGIEYTTEGKRIDLLLENTLDNSLLAIELKAGQADFRVFGQISMYLGLLTKKFPDKVVKGVIIAGEIDDSLKNACLITDKIELKTYSMKLSLENIN